VLDSELNRGHTSDGQRMPRHCEIEMHCRSSTDLHCILSTYLNPFD